MIWRWDQGRTAYFNFESICKISSVLLKYNGANMQLVDSTFRDELTSTTGLPFAPEHYTIKRNYKRVFECSMLASYIGNRLIISDIGRAIANGDSRTSTVDGYLYEVERRFRYPYPAFNNYSDVREVCFPFLAMIKYLLAKAMKADDASACISLEEIGSYLIANEVTGLEDLDFYWDLQPSSFSFEAYSSNDQRRQVREMMTFIGQHSYLNYSNSSLFLNNIQPDDWETIFDGLVPLSTEITSHNPVDDFIKMTTLRGHSEAPRAWETEDDASLSSFSVQEGKKVFTSHFSRERNSALRKAFISANPDPICDVCGRNMTIVYPWTENMLEVHHLLPLSSFDDEYKENHTTSIEDVVGLCPSCHRAIHIYYKKYLVEEEKNDFESPEEAKLVYSSAKSEVQP